MQNKFYNRSVFSGSELEFKEYCDALFKHKAEFDDYLKSCSKLGAVKYLKELTGAGLKNAKEICDLYWEGKLDGYNIREDRKLKIERLAKVPLIDELVEKIQNLNSEKLHSLLMNFTLDELLTFDELIDNNLK